MLRMPGRRSRAPWANGHPRHVGRPTRRAWCTALAVVGILFSADASWAQPAPPTGLQASVTGNLLTLTWQAPALPVSGYVIEAGTASGLANIASVPVPAAPTTLTAPVANGTYFIRVRSVHGVTSAPSNEVSVTIGCSGPPAAPLGFAVAQGPSGNPVRFSWMPPAVPVSSFRLEAGSGSGLANLATVNLAGSATVFDVQAPRGTYHVRLRALNACGVSAPSAEVIVTVGGCITPAAPQGLVVSVSGQTVSLTWSPPPTGTPPFIYTLFAGSSRGASNLATVPLGAATSIQAAVPAGTYFVRVVATNDCGVSAASNEATFTVGTTTLPPLVGTWDGQVFNHPGSFGYGPVTSFVLRIDAQPPNGNQRLGRWQDNLGCTSSQRLRHHVGVDALDSLGRELAVHGWRLLAARDVGLGQCAAGHLPERLHVPNDQALSGGRRGAHECTPGASWPVRSTYST